MSAIICQYCGQPSVMVPCNNLHCEVGIHPWCDCDANEEIDGHWCDEEER